MELGTTLDYHVQQKNLNTSKDCNMSEEFENYCQRHQRTMKCVMPSIEDCKNCEIRFRKSCEALYKNKIDELEKELMATKCLDYKIYVEKTQELQKKLNEALEVIKIISKSTYEVGFYIDPTDDARTAIEFLAKQGKNDE